MSQPADPIRIPISAYPFFQEYDPASLDANRHTALIIERILAYGNRAEVRWLIETYTRERVREWVAQSGQQRLSWRRYHLWCMVFGLPEPQKKGKIWPH